MDIEPRTVKRLMSEIAGEGTQIAGSSPTTAIAIAPPVKKSWWDQLPLAIAVAVIGVMVSIGSNFMSRTSSTTDKSIELSTLIQQIAEDIKDQKQEAKEARAFQQQISLKVGALYTREEAQRDREEFLRKISALETQINSVNNRLDRAEGTVRLLQDTMKIMQEMILNRNATSRERR